MTVTTAALARNLNNHEKRAPYCDIALLVNRPGICTSGLGSESNKLELESRSIRPSREKGLRLRLATASPISMVTVYL